MISVDAIKLSLEEFIGLVEKCEDKAVKEYKEQSPEIRDVYIQFWVPIREKQCRKSYINDLKSEYLKNGWRQVDIEFVKDRTTYHSLMIRLWA